MIYMICKKKKKDKFDGGYINFVFDNMVEYININKVFLLVRKKKKAETKNKGTRFPLCRLITVEKIRTFPFREVKIDTQ